MTEPQTEEEQDVCVLVLSFCLVVPSKTSFVASKKPRHHLGTVGNNSQIGLIFNCPRRISLWCMCRVSIIKNNEFLKFLSEFEIFLDYILQIHGISYTCYTDKNLIQCVEYPLLLHVNNFTAGACCHGQAGFVLKILSLKTREVYDKQFQMIY